MWKIPDEQIVRIQNRIGDIRENLCWDSETANREFIVAVGELIGTLETIMFDERNYSKCEGCCDGKK